MESDYVYPQIADRRQPSEWQEDGAKDMLERARESVRDILLHPAQNHLPETVEQEIRQKHEILVPTDLMSGHFAG